MSHLDELNRLIAKNSTPPNELSCSFATYRRIAGDAKADAALAVWGSEPDYVLVKDGTVYPITVGDEPGET